MHDALKLAHSARKDEGVPNDDLVVGLLRNLTTFLNGLVKPFHHVDDAVVEAYARRRQAALVVPIDQAYPQFSLKRNEMLAQRGLGDVHLLRRRLDRLALRPDDELLEHVCSHAIPLVRLTIRLLARAHSSLINFPYDFVYIGHYQES